MVPERGESYMQIYATTPEAKKALDEYMAEYFERLRLEEEAEARGEGLAPLDEV